MKYEYQAKATRQFGIEFRSKLEAQWAYEMTKKKIEWEYADSPWHDFKCGKKHVEIKPKHPDFMIKAAERAFPFRREWHEKGMLFLCGSPEDHFICTAIVLDCDKCLGLEIIPSKKDAIKIGVNHIRVAWNNEAGIYGEWCDHGGFKQYGSFVC